MSDEEPRHVDVRGRRRRVLRRVGIGVAVLVVLVTSGLVVAYNKLQGNIHGVDITKAIGTDRPSEPAVPEGKPRPLNVLVLGSDSRAGSNIGGKTPGLSDTTMLLHLSADRTRAYGVSIPRDLMVQRPSCLTKNGRRTLPPLLSQFNDAYAVGGPACTIRTVEKITNVAIDHFVVINFAGFKDMVNAVDGVTVCVPQQVDDNVGHIHLPAGTYKVTGEQALDYVRVRHGIGAPTGDIGRMKRQQAFISAMIAKVVSRGTLTNPVRLYRFLDAATSSLTTDEAFANLKALASLGTSLKDIGLDKIQFVTVPNEPYTPDPNRLQLAAGADALWRRIRMDRPLGPLAVDALSPTAKPGKPAATPSSPSASPSGSASPGTAAETPAQAAARARAEAARKEALREAGLCT
ncbi:MAG: LytR family transcriptional regulator [Marmoricola sp.]|nr:LytR family transcriptional regulator [Marmoricola sp.]